MARRPRPRRGAFARSAGRSPPRRPTTTPSRSAFSTRGPAPSSRSALSKTPTRITAPTRSARISAISSSARSARRQARRKPAGGISLKGFSVGKAGVAINPPSDIVLDVLNAADPSRAEAVAQRLNALAGGSPASAAADFAKALDAARQSSAGALAGGAGMADARIKLSKKDAAAAQKAKNAQVEFEATLLNNLVDDMLPKDAAGVFGQGTAGDVWRSMLGDQIAHQIAKSGELGIAKRLFANHPLARGNGGAHASLVAPGGGANVAQASANPLSLPSGADYSDGAFLFTKPKT